MGLKYDQFYFENKIYDYFEFWKLYDKFGEQIYEAYNEKIYCPLCYTAPLTIVRRGKRHFRVSKNNMHFHASDCSYRLDEASRKETRDFYKSAKADDIKRRLQACMDYLTKKSVQSRHDELGSDGESDTGRSFFTIKTQSKKTVRLPQKFLHRGLSEEDTGIEKIFYGECRLYWIKKGKYNYLKVLNEELVELCSIYVSENVFSYLSKDISDIKSDKDNAEKYFICFVTELEEKQKSENKIYYDGVLQHSSHILIKKCENNTLRIPFQ
ncbi:MAG: hypothetical protein HDT28_01375 [Clostridiales bacterium]|nr:hypothetical protein [Clostridiales bacterium]